MPRGVSAYDEARLQGRLWTPIVLGAVLTNWHDPSNPSGIVTSGGLVKSDADLGPSGYTESTTGGNGPTYVANVLNGRSAEKFTSSTQFNTCAMPSGSAARTFIVVCQPTALGSTQTIYGGSAPNSLQFRIESNGAIGLVSQGVANIAQSNSSGPLVSTAAPQIITGSYRQANGAYSFRRNGVPIGSGSNVQTVKNTNTTVLGYNVNNAGETLSAYLGERVVIASDALYDIQRVEGRLAWAWGVPLGAGDPFANRPPLNGD